MNLFLCDSLCMHIIYGSLNIQTCSLFLNKKGKYTGAETLTPIFWLLERKEEGRERGHKSGRDGRENS